MKIVVKLSLVCSLIMPLAMPALAGVTVNSPTTSSEVASPFTLSADAATCSAQAVSAMGYSIDNSSDTTIVNGTAVNASVEAPTGNHTLHVKAWGEGGSVCVQDVALTVVSGLSTVPPNATSVSSMQALNNWQATNDTATQGGSTGTMTLVNSPSMSGTARQFVTTYTNNGGQRYAVTFGDDQTSQNFFYDGWVYFTNSASSVANLEMDMNQVMENGQTVIYGIQCDGWNGTWDYTTNSGTPENPVDKWVHSKAPCNPRAWSKNTWHHVQLSYSRDTDGMVTYKTVALDSVQQTLNATVPSAFALGWSPTLLTNFQLDGFGAKGTNTVYLDELTISRW